MSIVKSLSVGNGDMFYIKHNSDNFTIIDCSLDESNKRRILKEINKEREGKGITRFISTHPDQDHISGLDYLDTELELLNFYCVKNEASKEDETDDFEKYCELRDSKKAYNISKGCQRKWMNQKDEERGSSGINIHWPVVSNQYFKDALQIAKDGGSPNNISSIIEYTLNGGVNILWMGDLETEFLENIEDELTLPKVDILFAPHHGRYSGKVPESILEKLDPKIIIIGEAPSKHIDYYDGYNTITQNSAGDITLDCVTGKVHIYVSKENYSVDFLDNESMSDFDYYIGTLNV